MAKVEIRSLEEAQAGGVHDGFGGAAETRTYLNRPQDPIHVRLHRLAQDATLTIAPGAGDCAAYVWRGGVEAGGVALESGSSLIVERGASIDVAGAEAESLIVSFVAHAPVAEPRTGGHIHLLPNAIAPRTENLAGAAGVIGVLHANAHCPTCSVWLHENGMGAPPADAPRRDADSGVHSHTEAEVIFVLDGAMQLGTRRLEPGTALAIAADTLYSFSVAEEGLHFLNFRAAMPGMVRFKSGGQVDEFSYWRDLGDPAYLTPLSS